MRIRTTYTYTFSNFLLLITLLGFLSCMAISYRLWLPVSVQLPAIPVLSFLGGLPVFADAAISIVLMLLITAAIFLNKKNRIILYFILGFTVVAVLLDYTRIQPWVYNFWFLILLTTTKLKDRQLMVLVRVMLAGIYAWSAIQKLNITFITETFLWINEPLFSAFNRTPGSVYSVFAVFAIVIELLAGLGLLMRRTRSVSIFILVLMHIYILLILGPLGRNVNTVIWPWNMAFASILVLLYVYEERSIRYRQIVYLPDTWKWLVIIFFGALPALSFSGWWPQYFSSALYSGNKATSIFYLSDNITDQFDDATRSALNSTDNSISLNAWSLRELGVPPYPSEEIQKRIFFQLCDDYENERALLVFEGYSRPDIITGQREITTLFCDSEATFDHDN